MTQSPDTAIPYPRLMPGHFRSEVHPFKPRPVARFGKQVINVELSARMMGNHSIGRTRSPDPPRERARINTGYADPPLRRHPLVKRLAVTKAARLGHIFTDDTTKCMRRIGLDILVIRADITDMGESESNDLPRIARVGHNFLIAGHRCVKANFANRRTSRAKAPAPYDTAICQHQYPGGALGCSGDDGIGHGLILNVCNNGGYMAVPRFKQSSPSLEDEKIARNL